VSFAGVVDGIAVLDIGCGTGALTASVVAVNPSGTVVGIDPSAGFVAHAASAVPGARFEVADAQALPFGDDTFDRTVSLFVLNFVPDISAAVREIRRVTRPGGAAAAAVWDYQGGLQMLSWFWEEAVALDPSVEAQDEKHMPLCQQGALGDAWREYGFSDVVEQALTISQEYASFDDYWLPFLAGVGPSGAYVAGLDEAPRAALRDRLRARLVGSTDGPFALSARAWAVRGTA
jgi:ubiquinone/menaquinone biosynthesis C-methylase UbiE